MVSAVKAIAVLLLIFCSLLKPQPVFSFGVSQRETPQQGRSVETRIVTYLQDRYNALTAPDIIMLPISGISSLSNEFLASIENELFRQFVNSGIVRPVRMQRWLSTTFTSRASNPFAVISAIRAEEFVTPVNFIGKPFVFRGDNHYYFLLYIYPLRTYYPIIVFRQFPSSQSIERMLESSVRELQIRLSRPPSPFGRQRRVVIDNFNVDFFMIAELPGGDFDFVPAPFFNAGDTILRDGDDFFSRMMGYILYTTGMFQVFQLGDFREFSHGTVSPASPLVDYRIQGRVKLSSNECILYVDVINTRTGARVVSLRHPILSYSFNNIWNAYRALSVQIIAELFDIENYGVVPAISSSGRHFFANDKLIGWDTLENFVLPRGLHIIYTGSMYGINTPGPVNSYYVFLDHKNTIFTGLQGRRIWNLLQR